LLVSRLSLPDNIYWQITGNYVGPDGDHRAVLDFYDMFCVAKGKPLIVAEVMGVPAGSWVLLLCTYIFRDMHAC